MNTSQGNPAGRSGAATALCVLAALGTVLTQVDRIEFLAMVAVVAPAGLVVANGSLRDSFRDIRTALLIVAITALFDVATGGGMSGLRLFLRFSALVCAAQIVTTLWSWAELSAALVTLLRPFDRIGLIDAERCAFTLMLAIRFVPVMSEEMTEIREAQALRGLNRSVLALAVPLGLRILLRAEEIAEAVDLRSRPSARRYHRDGLMPIAKPSLSSRAAP
ncbi:energy-coupling factor transporter transmembrane protein EcfT (plasmid) [Azospirillum humicireducens]|uniref:Energy-coupling factor transporter transmembrane protein EcfT n=1 Tax=Azospirillum humicireducens TaxID=1226968 RepID=A0A2R4VTZ1_9PROT|nr:energy-coupling factor transporter transmembrane protein EcfT [Azospirillum humicireducens]AWB07916.1 energy-coupling factor transporter transmembrane protein EcfT [Azospirillum humicireducens]